jgi:hypothetical protein
LSVTELQPQTGRKIPYYHAEVEVSFSPGDMHRKGWHHQDECPGGPAKAAPPVTLADGWTTVAAALRSLHQQAHGPGDISACRSEPCASLSLDQLRGAA